MVTALMSAMMLTTTVMMDLDIPNNDRRTLKRLGLKPYALLPHLKMWVSVLEIYYEP